ncbi:uncharacterized protein ARMOST_21447 [Armillaria ostoyae]|uniref:Reverse transcriptase domain-containing protein n=1 Tax=Armillaria ostoyae TaxID=47428 RepID=A0A284SA31_ARMOS|nr:uncharacterized protein ARMOST_15416 [Armillaria ostoyae]SJL17876.1 uncharacterized protein ARMOST_21441 [Armillaria ostoyae]SJL17878.1 uncharacterized protein ARMOST_21444 [Armillaria ostoyae]SJL17880.1 uncharacterized protein ARMOST_21447 [Armillaria ostoyae]
MFHSPRKVSLIKDAWNDFKERLRWRIYFSFTAHNDEDSYDPDFEVPRGRGKRAPLSPQYIEAGIREGERFVSDTIAKIPAEEESSYPAAALAVHPRQISKFLEANAYVVTSTDKNLGLAVSTRQWINEKSLEIVGDVSNYTPLHLLMVNAICDKQCTDMEEIALLAEAHLPNGSQLGRFFRSKITSQENQHVVPTFYGIPKIHKEPVKMRPIIPCHSAIQNPAAKYVSKILKPLIKAAPTIIHGSKDLAIKLSQIKLQPGRNTYIVTGDVVAFYPNIPIDKCIDCVVSLYREHYGDGVEVNNEEMLRAEQVFIKCLQTGNKNLVLRYGDSFYKQKSGLAMGVADSPDLANLYGHWFERQINLLNDPDIPFYGRYIDDCLAIVHASSSTEALAKITKVKYDGCKIEWEVSEHHHEFLDMMIYIDSKRTIEHMPYRKSRSHQERIPWVSFHPITVKRGTFIGEMSRLATLSSKMSHYDDAIRNLNALYVTRGYPAELCLKWTRENFTERWSSRLRITTKAGEDDGVLVLKSQYNTAWDYFSARELGDSIINTWRSRIDMIDRLRTAPLNSAVLHGQIPPEKVPSELCLEVETTGGTEEIPDIRKIGILNRRMIVSKKRTRNLFDLTNLWKRTVLLRLDEDVLDQDNQSSSSEESVASDSSDRMDIDPNLLIQTYQSLAPAALR